ncbi:MAG: gamma-glutamyl-gamma-aminobutyrate hydrolase family protein, partial [Thermoguttaceae bacterium]|nr:gamma-glutamyl-gamma-aminobutyrate hydrolase family protein [Thermoguttaceae bacterium]
MPPILVLQHAPHETLGSLEQHLREAGLAWRTLELFREVPRSVDLDGAAGLVVLGGPMNVDETGRYPFLVPEVAWIRQAIDIGMPLLGICLGAQLLAKALGARVYPNGVKEIGW